MSKEHAHRQQRQHSGGPVEESQGRDTRQMAMMQRAHQQKRGAKNEGQNSAAIADARNQLKTKVGADVRETMYAALDIFQAQVRADDRHETEVSIGFTKVMGEKVSDWLQDKALDVAKEAFDMSETVVGGAISTVFSSAKGRLEAVADAGQKIRASEAVDKLVAEARTMTDHASRAAETAVSKIPDEKMMEIAGLLDLFEEVKSASDSEREGTLKHALQNWVMEDVLGAPKTGGAAMHEHAVELYEVYSLEVSKGKPAREHGKDARNAISGKLHQDAEEGAAAAEKKLGIEGEVEKDTHERERVQTEAGE